MAHSNGFENHHGFIIGLSLIAIKEFQVNFYCSFSLFWVKQKISKKILGGVKNEMRKVFNFTKI